MITVIIPTASRPAMLRTALKSVAEQTARDKIGRIFVSENGGTRDSEQVCAEFPSLPITYLFRVPTTPHEHGRILHQDCLQGEFTAYLHDDDWWGPSHLKNALEAFEANPNAGTYASAHFAVAGEISQLGCGDISFPWFGSNYAPLSSIWELSRLNVLMAELLNTMAHYSTMVARTEVLRKAAYIFDLGNPFDNDRMLIFALSTFGTFLYNPLPEAFIRNHAAQDTSNFEMSKRIEIMRETTRWMVQSSGKSWEMVATSFAKRVTLCPNHAIHFLRDLAAKPWCLPELLRNVKAPLALNEECLKKLWHLFEVPKQRASTESQKMYRLPKPQLPRNYWTPKTQPRALELTASLENMVATR